MKVEDIDVVGAKLLQRGLNGVMQGLDIVADEGAPLLNVGAAFVVGCILEFRDVSLDLKRGLLWRPTNLCSNYNLVTNTARLHPFSNKLFGALILAAYSVSMV